MQRYLDFLASVTLAMLRVIARANTVIREDIKMAVASWVGKHSQAANVVLPGTVISESTPSRKT